MSDRVEGLARALYADLPYFVSDRMTPDDYEVPWDELKGDEQEIYRNRARAALAYLEKAAEEEGFTEDIEELANCAISALSWLRSLGGPDGE